MRGVVVASKPALPGPGIIIVPMSEGELHSLDTAAVQKLIAQEVAATLKAAPIGAPLKGSAQLDFPAIVDGTCSGYMNFQLPGVAAGDALAPIWPDMEPGVEPGAMRVIGAGLVGVKICFFSSGPVQQKSIDPLPKVFGAAVVR